MFIKHFLEIEEMKSHTISNIILKLLYYLLLFYIINFLTSGLTFTWKQISWNAFSVSGKNFRNFIIAVQFLSTTAVVKQSSRDQICSYIGREAVAQKVRYRLDLNFLATLG